MSGLKRKSKPMKVKLCDRKITLTEKIHGPTSEKDKEKQMWHLNHDMSCYFTRRKEDKEDNADK